MVKEIEISNRLDGSLSFKFLKNCYYFCCRVEPNPGVGVGDPGPRSHHFLGKMQSYWGDFKFASVFLNQKDSTAQPIPV